MSWFRLVFVQFFVVLACAAQADTLYHLRSDSESMLARGSLLLDPTTKSVDIATFQLKLDEAGTTLLAALVPVAQSGGQVRLAIDNQIMKSQPGLVNYLRNLGIKIRFFNPVNIKLSDFINPVESFHRYNKRLHIKGFIVNRKVAILGDKNYTLKSYHLSLPTTKNQTTMLGKEFLIEGPAVQQLSISFEQLWDSPELQEIPERAVFSPADKYNFEQSLAKQKLWLEQALEKRGTSWKQNPISYSSYQVFQDNPESRTMKQVLEKLREVPADSQVLIENPYFVLFPELENTLRDLRKRNVRIVLVLNSPEVSDIKLVSKALNIDLPKLLEMGIEVELIDFKRRVTHGKLILIGDDTVIMGSGNLDPRSYNINTELNLLVQSPQLNQELWKQFESTRHIRSRAVMSGISCSEILNTRTYSPKPVSKPVRYFIELARPYL